MENSDAIYEELRKAINKIGGVPISRTKSGAHKRFLKKLFTGEEARMYLHMTADLESAQTIAARAKQDIHKVEGILKRMTEKGLTFPKRKGDTFYYAAAPFAHGIIENQLGRIDKELAEIYEEIKFGEQLPEDDASGDQAAFIMPLRVVPVVGTIDTARPVAPFEDAKAMIQKRNRIAVAHCFCQEQQRLLGKEFNLPSEVCLLFGFYAEYYVEMGKGRWITREEALEILKMAEDAGLVHQPSNNYQPDCICNCSWECCGLLQVLRQFPNTSDIVVSNYFAKVSPDLCNGCGACLERCPINAPVMGKQEKAEISLERCIGCGLCISVCPAQAITLVAKPEDKYQVPPKECSFMKTSEQFEIKINKR